MQYYGFEYFCGSNVLIRIGDMPLLEATGLSVSVSESKRPIYGYSSRHFDAVASGQVLVQGQLLINYVHQDYLFHAINAGLGLESSRKSLPKLPEVDIKDYMSSLGENPEMDGKFIAALKNQFWSKPSQNRKSFLNPTRNPHDGFSGINLRVTFGEQDMGLKDTGSTGILISNVHFLGRSNVININEDVIGEAYPFFARNIFSLQANQVEKYSTIDPTNTNFGQTIHLE